MSDAKLNVLKEAKKVILQDEKTKINNCNVLITNLECINDEDFTSEDNKTLEIDKKKYNDLITSFNKLQIINNVANIDKINSVTFIEEIDDLKNIYKNLCNITTNYGQCVNDYRINNKKPLDNVTQSNLNVIIMGLKINNRKEEKSEEGNEDSDFSDSSNNINNTVKSDKNEEVDNIYGQAELFIQSDTNSAIDKLITLKYYSKEIKYKKNTTYTTKDGKKIHVNAGLSFEKMKELIKELPLSKNVALQHMVAEAVDDYIQQDKKQGNKVSEELYFTVAQKIDPDLKQIKEDINCLDYLKNFIELTAIINKVEKLPVDEKEKIKKEIVKFDLSEYSNTFLEKIKSIKEKVSLVIIEENSKDLSEDEKRKLEEIKNKIGETKRYFNNTKKYLENETYTKKSNSGIFLKRNSELLNIIKQTVDNLQSKLTTLASGTNLEKQDLIEENFDAEKYKQEQINILLKEVEKLEKDEQITQEQSIRIQTIIQHAGLSEAELLNKINEELINKGLTPQEPIPNPSTAGDSASKGTPSNPSMAGASNTNSAPSNPGMGGGGEASKDAPKGGLGGTNKSTTLPPLPFGLTNDSAIEIIKDLQNKNTDEITQDILKESFKNKAKASKYDSASKVYSENPDRLYNEEQDFDSVLTSLIAHTKALNNGETLLGKKAQTGYKNTLTDIIKKLQEIQNKVTEIPGSGMSGGSIASKNAIPSNPGMSGASNTNSAPSNPSMGGASNSNSAPSNPGMGGSSSASKGTPSNPGINGDTANPAPKSLKQLLTEAKTIADITKILATYKVEKGSNLIADICTQLGVEENNEIEFGGNDGKKFKIKFVNKDNNTYATICEGEREILAINILDKTTLISDATRTQTKEGSIEDFSNIQYCIDRTDGINKLCIYKFTDASASSYVGYSFDIDENGKINTTKAEIYYSKELNITEENNKKILKEIKVSQLDDIDKFYPDANAKKLTQAMSGVYATEFEDLGEYVKDNKERIDKFNGDLNKDPKDLPTLIKVIVKNTNDDHRFLVIDLFLALEVKPDDIKKNSSVTYGDYTIECSKDEEDVLTVKNKEGTEVLKIEDGIISALELITKVKINDSTEITLETEIDITNVNNKCVSITTNCGVKIKIPLNKEGELVIENITIGEYKDKEKDDLNYNEENFKEYLGEYLKNALQDNNFKSNFNQLFGEGKAEDVVNCVSNKIDEKIAKSKESDINNSEEDKKFIGILKGNGNPTLKDVTKAFALYNGNDLLGALKKQFNTKDEKSRYIIKDNLKFDTEAVDGSINIYNGDTKLAVISNEFKLMIRHSDNIANKTQYTINKDDNPVRFCIYRIIEGSDFVGCSFEIDDKDGELKVDKARLYTSLDINNEDEYKKNVELIMEELKKIKNDNIFDTTATGFYKIDKVNDLKNSINKLIENLNSEITPPKKEEEFDATASISGADQGAGADASAPISGAGQGAGTDASAPISGAGQGAGADASAPISGAGQGAGAGNTPSNSTTGQGAGTGTGNSTPASATSKGHQPSGLPSMFPAIPTFDTNGNVIVQTEQGNGSISNKQLGATKLGNPAPAAAMSNSGNNAVNPNNGNGGSTIDNSNNKSTKEEKFKAVKDFVETTMESVQTSIDKIDKHITKAEAKAIRDKEEEVFLKQEKQKLLKIQQNLEQYAKEYNVLVDKFEENNQSVTEQDIEKLNQQTEKIITDVVEYKDILKKQLLNKKTKIDNKTKTLANELDNIGIEALKYTNNPTKLKELNKQKEEKIKKLEILKKQKRILELVPIDDDITEDKLNDLNNLLNDFIKEEKDLEKSLKTQQTTTSTQKSNTQTKRNSQQKTGLFGNNDSMAQIFMIMNTMGGLFGMGRKYPLMMGGNMNNNPMPALMLMMMCKFFTNLKNANREVGGQNKEVSLG